MPESATEPPSDSKRMMQSRWPKTPGRDTVPWLDDEPPFDSERLELDRIFARDAIATLATDDKGVPGYAFADQLIGELHKMGYEVTPVWLREWFMNHVE